MKPFQSRCPSAQVEGKRPAGMEDLCLGEKAIALLARSRPSGIPRQVPRRRECRPSFVNFAIEPATGIDEPNGWADSLDPGSLLVADPLNAEDSEGSHYLVSST